MSAMRLIYGNEKGMVLPLGLMFLAIIAILGSTAVIVTTTDLKIGSNYRQSVQAFYIAEAGLARAEAELINDLNNDHDLSNTSFEAISGTIAITPSSTAFYTPSGFSNISFGAGNYTIQFKNYAPDPAFPNDLDPTIIWVRSIGTGPNSSTATLESYLSAENLSPWNNAIFSGGGGAGGQPLNGNINIGGSIHILGEGYTSADVVVDSQTGQFYNRNSPMHADCANAIDGGTTNDLNAKFRVKTGKVQFGSASGFIGEATYPFKGIYVQSGTDASPADGTNDDIINGSGKLHADKGATSAEAYDLEDFSISMPSIDTTWFDDAANCLDLTGTTDTTDTNPTVADRRGLVNGNLIISGQYNPPGPGDFTTNFEKYDGTDWASSTNGIRMLDCTTTPPLLEIKGIVKVSSLEMTSYKGIVGDTIAYSGKGTIYTTGTSEIDVNVLPNANNSYPTTNVFGVVSTGNLTLPSTAQKNLTGAYYTAGTATCAKSDELAGTIVCQSFNISAQVPSIWQIPSLANNLPPGMPGAAAIWVFTDRTWREITE